MAWSFILFLVLLAAAFVWRLARRPRPQPARPVAAAVQTAAPAPPQSVEAQLQALSQPLADQAEKTTHPRQMLDFADFHKMVA